MASAKTANRHASAFNEYLRAHYAGKDEEGSHTRIGDREKSIAGGKYFVSDDEWPEFMRRYYTHVFEQSSLEYLTEKQLLADGPILIDLDFRYDKALYMDRQHSEQNIVDALYVYFDNIFKLVKVTEGVNIEVYVMEKKDVNVTDQCTKDGIHILIGLKMHKALQVLLRQRVMATVKLIWEDLPVTNSWDDVFDEGVTKGHVNWQMYGSRKPGNQAYMLKYFYTFWYNELSEEWTCHSNELASFSTEHHFEKLSARYTEHPFFEMLDEVQPAFDQALQNLTRRTPAANARTTTAALGGGGPALLVGADSYEQIKTMEQLDECLKHFFENLQTCDYRLFEIHNYVMNLPATYYGPGSESKWIRVGWALANKGTNITKMVDNNHMFLTWLKFSSREICRDTLKGANGRFDWNGVPQLYQQWKSFNTRVPGGLTHKSIMFWCREDNPVEYEKIRKVTTDYFLEHAVTSTTDFDLATVLYSMYKDKYVCASVKHKVWYNFSRNRWRLTDSANELRMAISKEMVGLVCKKAQEAQHIFAHIDPGDTVALEKQKKIVNKLNDVQVMLKTTTKKDHIMREASELFYDKDFFDRLDQNRYLMCFENAVVDFQNKLVRPGLPDDYLSKCTNVEYLPYGTLNTDLKDAISKFMTELFPNLNLRTYMWEHLASVLIGVNKTQTFNVYIGSGANGKSMLVELFSKGLGDYVGQVPITLITQKRNSIGSTSSEVAQLVGVRYAVMQEPTKGDHINEGVLKELTGGDKITARALFKDSITFTPAFKLVTCTNTDFEGTSTDDGTWRRMRYVDFAAKFLPNPYGDQVKYPTELFPYQYQRDDTLEEKFEVWAPVLMSMLVDLAMRTQGLVKDCAEVLATSDKYRNNQDYFTSFANEKIRKAEGSVLLQTDVQEEFKKWFILNHNPKVPKNSEVKEFMNSRFGALNKGAWHNIALNYDEAVAIDVDADEE